MDMLDALYCRKTVYKYTSEKISKDVLEKIREYVCSLAGFPEGIEIDADIICSENTKEIRKGPFSSAAPYYIIVYTEEKPKKYLNAGFIIQKTALYLCTLGLGCRYLVGAGIPKKLLKKGDKEACVMIAFGFSKGSYCREKNEAVRMTSVQLSVYQETPGKWTSQLIDAARFAPSDKNDQPWRFLVFENEFHIYTKYRNAGKMKKQDEIDFGSLYANILTAAEELWLDVDLIRLEDHPSKSFTDDQYVISVMLK